MKSRGLDKGEYIFPLPYPQSRPTTTVKESRTDSIVSVWVYESFGGMVSPSDSDGKKERRDFGPSQGRNQMSVSDPSNPPKGSMSPGLEVLFGSVVPPFTGLPSTL